MAQRTIYIVSGGTGASGEHLVRTALAQFEDHNNTVEVVPRIEHAGQIEDVVRQAAESGGLIAHTLVDARLRAMMIERARDYNAAAIDLMGPLLLHLTRLLQQEPLGQPGLYRQLREDYFDRIEAIEFTVDHDDGRKPHELHQAEIVLVGVSRTGKTPLSMYLSTRGWKVANVPLVQQMTPPDELFAIDSRRVVGLTVHPNQLITYRRRRQSHLGNLGQRSPYTHPEAVQDEIAYARAIFRRGGFAVVDVTDKPIEESADDVIAHVTRRLRE